MQTFVGSNAGYACRCSLLETQLKKVMECRTAERHWDVMVVMRENTCLGGFLFQVTPSPVDHGKGHNYHKSDEQVQIALQRGNKDLNVMEKPFVICSVNATIKILKKYVAIKIGLGLANHSDLDILCNNEILGKDHSLKFVLATRWRSKSPPMLLEYRPRVTLL